MISNPISCFGFRLSFQLTFAPGSTSASGVRRKARAWSALLAARSMPLLSMPHHAQGQVGHRDNVRPTSCSGW